ncbi:uncharacterized protein [Argopecten irradians]|uniref:uncharacterized protein n=1 Tax=Argopecten irradians TaxID=31199 RepID=UPI00371B5F76
MAIPSWNPWGLVSPSRRPVSGSVAPPQPTAASGAVTAGPRKVRRTFRTSASRAVPFVSESKGRASSVRSKPSASVVRSSAPKRHLLEPAQESFHESVSFAGPFLPVGTSGPGNEEDMDCEVVGSAEDDDVVHLSPGCSDIDQSGLSDADPQVEDFQEEGDLEAAEVDAQQVLPGMRALRADVSRIIGAEVCPPPSASSIPESTTLLGSLVAPRASAQSDRSLPEGTIVSSALATAQSRVMEKNSSSSRTLGFAGLQLSVGDLSEVQASDYAIHDGLLSSQPAKLESRELAAWPGKSVDQVVFGSKEHHKMERLLRLSIQILSYIDFLTVSLYRVSDVPEGRISETEQADIQDRVTSALNRALRALASLQVSLLANVLLARRFSVFKNRPVEEPYRSRLLTAPFSGSSLFGGTLPSVQKDLKEDSVASALLLKRLQTVKASTSQGSVPPKKKARTSAPQSTAQPKSKPFFKGNKGKGKKGKNPPGDEGSVLEDSAPPVLDSGPSPAGFSFGLGSDSPAWEGLDLPRPDLPVGGRLSFFLSEWKEITEDTWALSVVKEGLGIPLLRDPPLASRPIFFPPPGDPEKALAIQEEVRTMLLKGAVEEVPMVECTPGFYSRMFLVRKKSGAWRPIIDLSAFNRHVDSPHFKMETPRSIIASVREGMWATSVDLKDAYFHIPIKKSARKFLRFTCNGKVFQFQAMPFGLTRAPLVFTKLLQVVVGFLHSRGIDVHIYFDDSLMLHLVRESLVQNTRLVLKLLLKVGFIPSREKSEVSPSRDFVFLGNRFNTVQGIALPPLEKFEKARDLALTFISWSHVQVRWFLSFLGYLNSLADVVPLGRLHIRPLQMFLLANWVPASREWEAWLPLNQSVKEFARWWTLKDNVLQGVPLSKPAPTMTLFTDASMTGWGAYLDGHCRSGGNGLGISSPSTSMCWR